eukprot:8761143-Heterocapsa_arctica.AAC.1
MAVHELLLHESPQFGSVHRVLRTDPELRAGGIQTEGKGKEEQGGLSTLQWEEGLSPSRPERAAREGKSERANREK